jgi:hypothetical protein
MSTHEVAIHEDVARRIGGVLMSFLAESSAGDALLIDRSGQLLAHADSLRALDTVSMAALTSGMFREILRETRVVRFASRGSIREWAGTRSTSSKVKPSVNLS